MHDHNHAHDPSTQYLVDALQDLRDEVLPLFARARRVMNYASRHSVGELSIERLDGYGAVTKSQKRAARLLARINARITELGETFALFCNHAYGERIAGLIFETDPDDPFHLLSIAIIRPKLGGTVPPGSFPIHLN